MVWLLTRRMAGWRVGFVGDFFWGAEFGDAGEGGEEE